MRTTAIAATAFAALLMAACVPRATPPAPAPTPPREPAPQPAPLDPSPPPPAATNWLEAPLSPGDWRYRQDSGAALASYEAGRWSFSLRCEQGRSISLWMTNAQASSLTIRTSYGDRNLPAEPVHLNEMVAALPVGDALFDQMAFSRGRLFVQAGAGAMLIVPAWPEIARLVEECRGGGQ